MSEQWEFYFARVNDALASIYLDVAAAKTAPDPQNPWLHWVWVNLRRPRQDGLSDSEEAPRLYEIEDALSSVVRDTAGGLLVGRITTSGRREFYFYGPRSEGLEHAVTEVLGRFPDYEMESGTKRDEAWSHYFNVLYPSPEDWRRIKNGHVLEHLEREGDRHELPRPVRHWAYFPSAKDREAFLARLESLGFAIVGRAEAGAPAHPYGVTFERTDSVESGHMNELTIELLRMAIEGSGTYDGWETSVERGGD